MIVTSGALGDVLGRRKVFLGGLFLFVGSCILIALSQGAAGVVGGRMIQGASGATILACGMSLLWEYVAFLGPMIVLSVGLGFANGPASAGSTAAVEPEQVGSASGISNMARYVGAAVAVAAVAMIDNAVATNHREAGESASQGLAAGLGASALAMAIASAGGVSLIALMRRQQIRRTRAVDRAAAAAASLHTIPTEPTTLASEAEVHPPIPA